MRLMIIEAFGKIQSLTAAARATWPHQDVRVLATGGMLRDLASDERQLGLDPIRLVPLEAVDLPNAADFRTRLAAAVAAGGGADAIVEVLVMTDPDREGEAIAAQVFDELESLELGSRLQRAYTTDMSPHGLRNLVRRPAPHAGMLASRTGRRVIDRLIPHFLVHRQVSDSFLGLGRVALGALGIAAAQHKKWPGIAIEGEIRHEAGNHVLQYRTRHPEQAEALLASAKHAGELTPQQEVLHIPAPAPYHAGSALVDLSRRQGIPPETIMQYLQKAYMAGRLSYPRTDNSALNRHARESLGSIASELLLGAQLRDNWFDASEQADPLTRYAQLGHPGLYGTVKLLEDPAPEYPMAIQLIERAILARGLASLMRPAVIRKSSLTLEAGARRVQAVQLEILEPGWLSAYQRLDQGNPLLPARLTYKPGIHQMELSPTAADFLDWLQRAGLGRPATLVGIAPRLQRAGLLSPYFCPTRAGEARLEKVKAIAPALITPAFHAGLEQDLQVIAHQPDRYGNLLHARLEQIHCGFEARAEIPQTVHFAGAPG